MWWSATVAEKFKTAMLPWHLEREKDPFSSWTVKRYLAQYKVTTMKTLKLLHK